MTQCPRPTAAGPTTVAARRSKATGGSHAVHLTTTDPAGDARGAVHAAGRLRTSRLDPAAETERCAAHVMATGGAGLDAAGRALLAEDRRSPWTEEIAVFQAFARAVAEGQDGLVVDFRAGVRP